MTHSPKHMKTKQIKLLQFGSLHETLELSTGEVYPKMPRLHYTKHGTLCCEHQIAYPDICDECKKAVCESFGVDILYINPALFLDKGGARPNEHNRE